jgi:SecD/SecF fusion protein
VVVVSEQKNLLGRTLVILLVVGLAVAAFAARGFRLNLGQDLRGGTTLRFSIDLAVARRDHPELANQTDAAIVEQTLAVVATRVDKYGLAELNVVPVGEDKFEISIPREMESREIENIVTALGNLQFRILVDPENVRDDQARPLWDGSVEDYRAYKEKEVAEWKKARDAVAAYKPTNPKYRVVKNAGASSEEARDFSVLLEPQGTDDRFGGEILTHIVPSTDGAGMPAVSYDVKTEYQGVFGAWTEKHTKQPMAIVLSDEFLSAPVIQTKLTDSVQITLGVRDLKEARQRQKELVTVLQTGSLKVKPSLESRATVGPTLAGRAVRTGLLSTAIAFALVLLYMAVYYFFAGIIADVALLLNLVLTVGAMAFLGATLTLPGLAGVVLSLGMAVDANILIFERIREEQARGRSVARAVGEGFERAFTTIVDSNVTTFFTALFLYAFGTGSIQGFAVTLTLGLLASMFTAVYVTRTMIEAWIRRGNVAKIRMLGEGRPPNVRWMGLRRLFLPASAAMMLLSVGSFLASDDETVYAIEFTGGMKLQARFATATSVDEVKHALDSGPRTVKVPRDLARGEGNEPLEATVGPYPDAEVVSVEAEGGDQVEIRVPLSRSKTGTVPLRESEQLSALRAYVEQAMGDRLVPSWMRSAPSPYVKKSDDDPLAKFDGRLHAVVSLEDPGDVLTPELLEDLVVNVMPYTVIDSSAGRRREESASKVKREAKAVPATEGASKRVKTYDLHVKSEDLAGESVDQGPDKLRQDLREFFTSSRFKNALRGRVAKEKQDAVTSIALADRFPVDDLVGAGFAHKMRNDALVALLLSFVAIIAYVAFRFRSYSMGFASVYCLVHDVLAALLGVVIACHLGFVDAKINLGLVAAFLTIVGFSVNDTVVTYDRIRELRGKAPGVTARMIEDAVNQTFARTLRTTLTVLMTVLVLFLMNLGERSMLEGLSYTLLIGVVVGCYSTIAVAAPLLLFLPWFWVRIRGFRPRTKALTWPLKAPLSWVLLGACVVGAIATFVLAADHPNRLLLTAFVGLVAVPFGATLAVWLAWCALFGAGAFLAWTVLMVPWSFLPDPEAGVEEARRAGVLAANEPVPPPPPPPGRQGKNPAKGPAFSAEEEA